MNKVVGFFKDVRNEMSRVTWPARDELINSTGVVIVTTIVLSIFVGIVNLIISRGVGWVLTSVR